MATLLTLLAQAQSTGRQQDDMSLWQGLLLIAGVIVVMALVIFAVFRIVARLTNRPAPGRDTRPTPS